MHKWERKDIQGAAYRKSIPQHVFSLSWIRFISRFQDLAAIRHKYTCNEAPHRKPLAGCLGHKGILEFKISCCIQLTKLTFSRHLCFSLAHMQEYNVVQGIFKALMKKILIIKRSTDFYFFLLQNKLLIHFPKTFLKFPYVYSSQIFIELA